MNRTKLNIVSFAAAVAAGLFAVGCGSSDKGGTSAAGNAADSARTVGYYDRKDAADDFPAQSPYK